MAAKVEGVDLMRVKIQWSLEGGFVFGGVGSLHFIHAHTVCKGKLSPIFQEEPFWLSLNYHNNDHLMLRASYSARSISKGPGSQK